MLELQWFGLWTLLRFATAVVAGGLALGGALLPALLVLAASELVARWLFFVAVVPLNMPGGFWRGAAGAHR